MSLTNFQNNRVVHRNDTSQIQLGNDNNTLTKSTNDKLDSQITQQTAVNTKLDQLSGAINNNIGDGSVKLQTYVYGHDSSGGVARPLAVTANGELKVSNDVLEVSAETVNLNTDTLEAKTQAITDKLDTFAGAGNNNIGEGSSKLQTYLYARDVSAGNFKPLVCDGDAHLQVDVLSTALPTGGATEATLLATKNALFTNPAGTGNTAGENLSALNSNLITTNSKIDTTNSKLTTIDTSATAIDIAIGGLRNDLTQNGLGGGNKAGVILEAQNTNLIAISNKMVGGQTTSGMSTAANQQVIDLTLQGIDGILGNIETAVQLIDNAVDGNYLNINQNIAGTDVAANSGNKSAQTQRVVIATDDINQSAIKTATEACAVDLAAIETLITTLDTVQDNALTKLGEIETSADALISANHTDLVALESSLTSMEGKQDTVITALQLLDNAVDGNYLNVNQNIAGTDVAANSGNKSAQTQRVVIATDDINQSAIKTATEACAVDLAAIETLITTLDTVQDNALTKLGEIETSADALISANHTDLVALEASLTSMEGKQDNMITALQLIDDVVKAEDAGHSSGDKGIMGLSVRKDTAAALGGTDADYQPLITDANGKLYTIPSKKFSAITTLFSGVSVGSSATSSASSAVEVPYESGAPSSGLGGGHRITFSSQSSTNSSYSIALTESMDDSTYFTTDTNLNDVGGGAQQNFMGSFQTSARYFKLTITNTHSGSQDFTIKVIGGELS